MLPLTLVACLLAAQTQDTLDVTAVGKDARWRVVGRTTSVVDTNGKHALKLIEPAPLMGLVWRRDYDFTDGVIDVDITLFPYTTLFRSRKSVV